jgi:hypothetical protein
MKRTTVSDRKSKLPASAQQQFVRYRMSSASSGSDPRTAACNPAAVISGSLGRDYGEAHAPGNSGHKWHSQRLKIRIIG